MPQTRKIEIFSAGCSVCDEIIAQIEGRACPSCEIIVLDIMDPSVIARAKEFGIRSIPAVVIDDKLVDCCAGRGPDISILVSTGLGQPLP